MISMIIIGDQVAPIFVGIQISLQLSWDPWADHWKTNQPSKDELMVLAMMWPAPIIKGIIYVEREVNIWYEENWGDMTMACNRTRANLCDNCICCISSIWLKVATAVSNHEMHVTFSLCCDFSILFNFKWHGLHFFNSLESCHASFRLR